MLSQHGTEAASDKMPPESRTQSELGYRLCQDSLPPQYLNRLQVKLSGKDGVPPPSTPQPRPHRIGDCCINFLENRPLGRIQLAGDYPLIKTYKD